MDRENSRNLFTVTVGLSAIIESPSVLWESEPLTVTFASLASTTLSWTSSPFTVTVSFVNSCANEMAGIVSTMDALRKPKEAGKPELYPDVNLRCTYSEMRCICTCFRNRGCVIEETHLMENIIYNELRVRGYNVDDGFHPDRLAGCSCSRRHHTKVTVEE